MSGHGGGESHDVVEVFHIEDKATGPMSRIMKSVNSVSKSFDAASGVLGGFASIAGVVGGGLSIGHLVEETKEHFGLVSRISNITGETVNHVDGMVEAFAKAGVKGEDFERIMTMTSRRGAMMEMSMQGTGEQASRVADRLKTMGVDMKKGPLENMEAMAEAAQKGKLGVADLMTTFGVRGAKAEQFYRMLKKGKEYLHENVEEAEKFNIAGNMGDYRRVMNATNDIKATWDRMMITVGAKLMPVLADLLGRAQKQMHQIAAHAGEFAEHLGKFISQHGSKLMALCKLMLANFALQKATGMGVMPLAAKLGGFILGGKKGAGGAAAAALGGKDSCACIEKPLNKVQHGLTDAWFKKGGNDADVMEKGLGNFANSFNMNKGNKGIGGIMDKLIGAGPVLGNLLQIVARFALVAVIIMMVVKGFEAIKENFMGIRGFLMEVWEDLVVRFMAIKIALKPVFDLFGGAFGADGYVMKAFKLAIPLAISTILMVVEKIMFVVQYVINLVDGFMQNIQDRGIMAAFSPEGIKQAFKFAGEKTDTQTKQARAMREKSKAEEATKAGKEAPDERAKNHYDFRGSKFDIKQQFAEGFDPDRIAVAFANDLSTLGERKLQSGFSPLFSVR